MTDLKAARLLAIVFALFLCVFVIAGASLQVKLADQQLAYASLRAENESLRRDAEFMTAEIGELAKQRDETDRELLRFRP
jgi:cell division protein FtsB